jgi:pimeloyl-ACP methyl ester carboxylesterase
MSSLARSAFTASHDGLRLHYLDFACAAAADRLPVVCLPGLTRSAEDFRALGAELAHASKTPRRVVALDYRGRGLSDHDPDWTHYSFAIERQDLLAVLAAAGIARAHFVGTSRGGLHIFGLATSQRPLIAAAVLNDIGPVIEPAGLARIKSYVGQSAAPTSYEDAIARLQIGAGRDFTSLTHAQWRFFAETTYGTDEANLGLRYDPQLARLLDSLDLTKPAPDMWAAFDSLAGGPVLTIRGAASDILSVETFDAMVGRWPQSQGLTIEGQGHAPLLADQAILRVIDSFLSEADRTA